MKKLLSGFLIALFLFSPLMNSFAVAESKTDKKCGENLSYTFDSKTGVLTISGTGKMYTYQDGMSPFAGDKKIKKVVIKNGVTSISLFAFFECGNIKEVEFAGTLREIADGAFSGCKSLANIKLPDNILIGVQTFENTAYYNNSNNWQNKVLYIGKYLISAKNNISGSYSVKSGTKYIASGAFYGCGSLTGITVPDTVVSIGETAFENCLKLKTVKLSNNLKSIAAALFRNCRTLTSVSIPENVTKIDAYAFMDCIKLGSIIIPNETKTIGRQAFFECTSLKSVKIPNTVTTISYWAFSNCSNLTSVTLPSSLNKIYDYTFNECVNLKSVIIPVSITTIGNTAFYCCNNLSNVYYLGSKTQWNKISVGYENEPINSATVHYNSRIVSFNANGGTITVATKIVESGKTLKLPTATRNGYTLLGWSTNKSATTATYKAGQTITVTKSMDLYAIWISNSHSHTLKWYVTKKPTYFSTGTKVQKCSSCGKIYKTATVDKLVLTAPATVKAVSVSAKSAKITYSKVNGAIGYQVYNQTLKKTYNFTANTCTINNLKPGVTYNIFVRGFVKNGSKTVYGKFSKAVKFKNVPSSVTGITAKQASTTSVKLTWAKKAGVSGYQVYNKTTGKTYFTTATEYTLKGLTKGKANMIFVRAYYTNGNTKYFGTFSKVLTVKQ